PDDYPQDADLPLPEPQPIADLGPLVQQARALMGRLQIALDQGGSKPRQQQLRRALRRASQRTLRRLRAEKHQPPAENADDQAPTPSPPPLQSVLVGAGSKAHLTIDNQTTLCGRSFNNNIITTVPTFVEHHDCPRCAQQARAMGYSLP